MDRTEVKSSAITSLGHEGAVLEVEYHNGHVYRYEPVTREQFDRLLTSPSVGTHVNQHIVPRCDCWKLVTKRAA
jgi:hypothetical protein